MPFSNLNLEAIIARNDLKPHQIKNRLFKLCQFLSVEKQSFEQVQLIDCKHLFIVKIRMSEQFESREVELAFKAYFMENTTFSEPLISYYLKKYPNLRPIYCLTKSVLRKHKLDELSSGGINSFSLVLMIASFLQQKEFEKLGQKERSEKLNSEKVDKLKLEGRIETVSGKVASEVAPVEQTFAEFLYFFGYLFDFRNYELHPTSPFNTLKSPIVKVG